MIRTSSLLDGRNLGWQFPLRIPMGRVNGIFFTNFPWIPLIFYGFHVGEYASQMDAMGFGIAISFRVKLYSFFFRMIWFLHLCRIDPFARTWFLDFCYWLPNILRRLYFHMSQFKSLWQKHEFKSFQFWNHCEVSEYSSNSSNLRGAYRYLREQETEEISWYFSIVGAP